MVPFIVNVPKCNSPPSCSIVGQRIKAQKQVGLEDWREPLQLLELACQKEHLATLKSRDKNLDQNLKALQ